MPARKPSLTGENMFDAEDRRREEQSAPLAARMRPRSLDEFVGQQRAVGPGSTLRRALSAGRLPSLIFWGPPGSGKTTLARILGASAGMRFVALSAVSSGVGDLRNVATEARRWLREAGQRTLLFIDEVHRFSKAQQDIILPFVEDGTFTLIGATTENPSFEVNSALLSRTRVIRLEALAPEDIESIIRRALTDPERGLGTMPADISPDALRFVVEQAGGDARTALNAVELAVTAAAPGPDGVRPIDLAAMRDALQHQALDYDRAGDQHYQVISAFIKSIRGSDPDAAVYWLARMLEGGEDPLFVARRLVILAAEDIGLADPQALSIAVAAQQAAHFVGMPEGYLPLTEATLYLALAPKSNSAITSYWAAVEGVRATRAQPVPLHLRNAVTGFNRSLGYGRDYKYSHDFAGHYVEQQYLPDALTGQRYYTAGTEGAEARLVERWQAHRAARPNAPATE